MIATIILAAGQSKRMGQPKMLLPWGKLTVIEQVISTFLNAGIEDIVVVTGSTRQHVEQVIQPYPVMTVHNSDYVSGEMLSSLQCGLRAISPKAEATLVGLGDQPQIQERSVRLICDAYRRDRASLVVPSFELRRGHPWLVARPLWSELLEMRASESPRDFLNRHMDEIHYVTLDTPSILADLDTPEDYQRSHP